MLDDSPLFQMLELDTVVSTNSFLRDFRPPAAPPMTLVTAEFQTGGRGQGTNRWESRHSENLLFSIAVRPEAFEASRTFALSEAIALSIAEAAGRCLAAGGGAVADAAVTVKWPNDVYVGDAKLAGILIENELSGCHVARSILGCGVNVNQTEWEFAPPPVPTSLRLLLGKELERRFVLEDIIDSFRRHYARLMAGGDEEIHAEYLARLYRRQGFHCWQEPGQATTFEAEIAGVERNGHLILCDMDGLRRRYAFKEVAYK